MCVLSLMGFVAVTGRLGYLQLYRHAALSQRVEREHSRQNVEMVERGAIMDRNGGVLAMSIEGGACFADPRTVQNVDETARVLSGVLHLPKPMLRAKLTQRKRFVWLARRLDPETAQRVQELHRPGIRVVTEMKRFYPEETLASHVLGVVGEEQNGLSGVELVADAWLSGRTMPFLFKQWKLSDDAQRFRERPGVTPNSLVLTIDRTLQYIVEQELAVQMKLSRPKSATVIVQDPQTGEILAMATTPSFNPNAWGTPTAGSEYGPETLKNPAVEKIIEPGSTFKLVTAAAALEQQLVKPSDGFFCENGNWQIQGRTIHDHERDGWLTFTEVMSHSSNIGTAKIAFKLGQESLYRFARAFGFGVPTGCGLPGDGAGILRSPNQWRAGSLATIAFGQEVGVSPLQMVNAYSVVANGGVLLEPRLYRGVIDDDGRYREWKPSKPIRRVLSARTVDQLKRILQEVVDRGTGKAAQVPGIATAGKTGTAQKIDPLTRQYSDQHYVASFCGFAPVDKPRLVIGVFLDEPQTNYWGGSEAAPLFARIVRDAASYLHLETNVGPLATTRTISKS